MKRLEAGMTYGNVSLWRKAMSGLSLFALSGLVTMTLTGCPPEAETTPDMGTSGDMTGNSDMASVKPQQPGCSTDAWCWLFPLPQGNTLWSVWGSSTSDAWAVGESGTILHLTGGQWKPLISPTKNAIYGIWGVDASDVYAIGDRGTVLHYDGQAWTAMSISGDTTGIGALYGIWGSGKDDVWMVGAGGVVLHKTSTGLSRMTLPTDPAYKVLLRSVYGAGGSVYAVGTAGSLLKYNGSAWSAITLPGAGAEILTSIAGTANGDLFVGSLSGAVRRYDNATMNWSTVSAFGNFGIYALWAKGTDVFAIGDVLYDPMNLGTKDPTKRQGIVKKYNGTSFADVAGTIAVSLYAAWGTAATDLMMVGASGTIVRYNGTSFTSSSPVDNLTGVSAPWNGLSGSTSDNLVAVGDWGATVKWDGTQWRSTPNDIYLRFRGISGPSDNLWAVADDQTPVTGKPKILQWNGSAWSSTGITLPGAFSASLRAIWVSGTDGVAVGFSDSVLRRSGNNWTAAVVTPKVGTVLRAIWGSDAQNVWIVGGGQEGPNGEDFTGYPGKILFYNGTDATESYKLAEADGALRGVWGSGKSNVWAVGDNGVLLRYTGSGWSRIDSGTKFGLRGVWGSSANDVYVVGQGGTVLHYDGQVWKRQDTGTGVSLVGVFGVGKDVFAYGYSGSILHKLTP